MLRRPPALRTASRYLIVAGGLFLGALALHADDRIEGMIEGIAVVTSTQGTVTCYDSAGKGAPTKLHETLVLNQSIIETGAHAQCFFALSNGIGIGIGPSSEVHFETYVQKPFPPRKERISHESSVSILSVRVVAGTLSLASNQLSPLSQARIHLPVGELRIHSASCIVQVDSLGSRITANEGSLTYDYPDGVHKEFLSAPHSIRITQQSAQLSQVTETTTLAALPEYIAHFAQATQLAGKRVLYKAGAEGDPPRPILLASPHYFEQPAVRPYEFND